jgi:hypothetical protein
MEAAEQAGIVSIDRVGPLTQLYNLTTPAGRDWVLSKERDLETEAKKGMTRRARGPRHFYAIRQCKPHSLSGQPVCHSGTWTWEGRGSLNRPKPPPD